MTSRPSICFVTDDFAGVVRNGGIGTHFLLMGRLLRARGWEVHVLYCGPVEDEEGLPAALAGPLADGVCFSRLDDLPAPVWDGVEHFGDGLAPLVTSQRAFEALERLHAEHRFDVIEFSDWRALGFRAVQGKRAGLAFADAVLAVKLHSTTEWQRRGNLENRRSPWELKLEYCERYAFEHADVQLSPSRYMLTDAREQGWAVRDDARVAYPFPARQGNGPAPAAEISELVFFGRLEHRKGLDLFLAAVERIGDRVGVRFIGRDAFIDGRPASELIAERMGERPYAIETELDRDAAIAALREPGRLAVIASRSESFGFTVAECIVEEVPFIASRAGAIPEVVAHDETRARWLFEPTADALVAAIERRLAAPVEVERGLRAAVAEACDPDRWNARVEAVYRELASMLRTAAATPGPASVTIAVTHHDHPAFLPSALAAIAAQTRAPDEVIVVDDGSATDEGRRVFGEQEARYPGWTFVRQSNRGPGAARNACLARCSSDYFLPLDSDNIAAPELVETLLAAALADGRDAATCHMLAFVDEQDIADGRFAFRYAPPGGPRVLTVLENVFGDTCGLFRARALRAVGGFESDRWSPHEDWETYTKLAFAGYRVDVVPRVLLFYRTQAGGRLDRLTAGRASVHRLRAKMIRTLLAGVELERDERIALWECLLAFGDPSYELERVTRELEDLTAWSDARAAELSAWHEGELAEAHAWRERELAEAHTWRERELAEIHAWREHEFEQLRAALSAQIADATARAERAEDALAAAREHLAPRDAEARDGVVRRLVRDVLARRRGA